MVEYKNSPIREAVCEFRFSKDTEWNKDLPSKLYDIVKSEFPIKEIRKEHRLEVKFEAKPQKKGVRNPKIEHSDRFLFLDKERKFIIQIAPKMISVNALKPYPSWKIFNEKIGYAYNKINELTDVRGIERIGLIYVNKIDVPEKLSDLKDYFRFYPQMPENLNLNVGNFNLGCDFTFDGGNDMCRVQLGRAIPEKKDGMAFLLSTDYFTAKPGSISPGDALSWTQNAHDEIKKIFKGCITEKMESLFNGAE